MDDQEYRDTVGWVAKHTTEDAIRWALTWVHTCITHLTDPALPDDPYELRIQRKRMQLLKARALAMGLNIPWSLYDTR